MGLPFLSAILGILAFLPANLWFFGFIFLAPLFVFFLKERRFWRLIAGAFIFRLFWGLGTAYFTLEPIMWLSSIVIFLGLPVSVFFIKKLTNAGYPLLFSLPLLWTFFDLLEARYSLLPTYIITAGNIFGSSPFSGLAGIGGLTLLIFFAALINVLIAVCVFPPEADPPLAEKIKNPKLLALNLTVIFFVILGAWQISVYQIQKNATYYNGLKNSLKIITVSVNEKFDWSDSNQIKNELAAQKPDLLVFPENAFNDIDGAESLNFYQGLSKAVGTNLVATFSARRNGKRYNSTFLFSEKGEIAGVYDKNRLTFLGEYWPFKNWRPVFYDWFKESNPGFENYAIFNPQNAYANGEKKLLSNFAVMICLEIHYPADIKEYKKMGAKFFIAPASNRWISAGLNHYLYLENNLRKIEAIWLKTPIIVSGVKDSSGVVSIDGKTNFAGYESAGKNYAIFTGEIKY